MRAFRIAYDGRPYRGFQRQPNATTVEGELFAALRRLGVFEGRKPEGYAAAGRTDAGVSALAQTVAFEAPDWLSPRALNSELPAPVRAWASADAPPEFHATHHALRREYVYHLHAPDADPDVLRGAFEALSGEHDFHNLTPDDRNTVRTLSISLEPDGDYFVVALRSGGFCRELVRRVVSLARSVGTGERSMAHLRRALSDEHLSGPDGIPPAPAHPLVLADVEYDLTFGADEIAVESARDVFASKRRERATAARVAGELLTGLESSRHP